MPNKKASRNAYFYFALEMIPELKRRGLPVCGVKDAIPYCSGDWALLSVEEKEKYAEKAKEWRNREDPPSPPRSRTGVTRGKGGSLAAQVTDVLARSKEEASRHQDQVRYHERLYRKSEDLERKVIYVINIFSHGDMPTACEQRFVPCEIGCVRYSLQEGITDSFHDFIDPGELPFGFRYHCQAGSAATHQIPVSGFELANHNYHKLYRSLCDFICPMPSLQVQIYCRTNDMYRVKWCLQWLAYKAGMDNRFELLDLESLILKYFRDKLGEEPSKSTVNRLLEVVHWDYASNTRCKWHEENDMWYCALASCKKVTYCISKALASVYDVTLTPSHLPSPTPKARWSSGDNKTIILDAKRFQKKSDRLRFTDNLDSAGAACGASTSGMNGAASFNPRRGRGRGILRLLEEMPDFNPTEG
ncbi:protein maelstrom homolog [Rana temporaria]|uniref:protein maelstrom homolog n=1 Tax=Rana temporaria TaxID=8407 RepID=UPI001AACF3CC|nr:protein maelstrom homolog [Rana temporaria]